MSLLAKDVRAVETLGVPTLPWVVWVVGFFALRLGVPTLPWVVWVVGFLALRSWSAPLVERSARGALRWRSAPLAERSAGKGARFGGESVTVAILAQGTRRAVAISQAFFPSSW